MITNFFEIVYDQSGSPSGATGGGYILSRGARTTARLRGGEAVGVTASVNGNSGSGSRTTRRAVDLLAAAYSAARGRVALAQTVETPIGAGFGTSAATATSAVYALAAAAGIVRPKKQLAKFAHRAEILEQTGLGTVSVVYNYVGAGAITTPGEPGAARFVRVDVPRGTKIVTACVGPFDKREAFSSSPVRRRVNQLGKEALACFLSDPTLDSLASQGEFFTRRLGVDSPEVRKLTEAALSAGAEHASQNMIGYSIHCIAKGENVARVARSLRRAGPNARVDVFEIGGRRAGVVQPTRRSRAPS